MTARQEALQAFGNADVYMERIIYPAKHIEFQILADQHGNVVHLGERDCSLQRKNQKIIEEAPSPSLSSQLRREMGEAAVRAAKAVGYQNAGTIEFLVDEEKTFLFHGNEHAYSSRTSDYGNDYECGSCTTTN